MLFRSAEEGSVFAYLDNAHAPDECLPPLELPGEWWMVRVGESDISLS